MKNPYGIRDGELVTVNDVERGLACNCTCPGCGHPLEAHKGELVGPYFSHYRGSECGVGYETALHLLAKEVLKETRTLLLPPLRARPTNDVWRAGTQSTAIVVVEKWKRISFDAVRVEAMLGSIVPDVILERRGHKLLVEIRVTHGIDEEKLEKIRALNISTIEYDFSSADRAITKLELKQALVGTYMASGYGEGYWVHNTKFAAAQEEANRLYLEEILVPTFVAAKLQEPPKSSPLPPPVETGQKWLFD